ncbi:MAG: DUF3857 domain-containing protein [Cyclobacteriaceae bacterium]
MIKYFSFALVLIGSFQLSAQSIIADIPDSLKNGMNEVVLTDQTLFEIESLEKSRMTRSYEVVIMNRFANDREEISLYYDENRTIKKGSVRVKDQFGKVIKKYGLKDFNDYSTKGSSVASDGRIKSLEIKQSTYPYIIEVSYAIEYNSSYSYPSWIPQSYEKQSILSASLAITSQLETPIRYKSFNLEMDSSLSAPFNHEYYWSISSLKGYDYERYSLPSERSPRVYTAPDQFQLDGRVGSMKTWKSYGKWIYELNQGRNTLTSEQLSEITPALLGAETKIDSLKAVYDYLQANMRYVSIQLGIGGLQPFESGFVHEKKYGDCKALSFYTQSILDHIGIPSYYTLISGGYYPSELIPDFPKDYFNHVILTVPIENDTIWLECTSQTSPFGSMGTFTGNRYALLVDQEGGHLIKTKHYSLDENVQITKAKIFLEEKGKGQGRITRTYKGQEIENDGFRGAQISPESKQREWFIDEHDWGNISLVDLNLSEISNEPVPSGQFEVEVEFANISRPTGNRLFYSPFIFTNLSGLKLPSKERSNPIHRRYPYTQIDTIEVILPTRYQTESLLKEEEFDSNFGSYSRKVLNEENSLILIRKLEMNAGDFPAEDYSEFRDFVHRVQKHDRQKIVLIDKT